MRLEKYLQTIGLSSPQAPVLETLQRVHLAHRERFLFDNLSIQTGSGVSLALADLERKFLEDGRGGYCFEHNTLFAAALRELGFAVTPLLGRVRRGPPERWVRTHLVLQVAVANQSWLADVGFGGFGLLEPILLENGATATQGGATYQLRHEGGLWILAMSDRDSSVDLYEFTEDPQTLGDIEVANHYTATHPDSRFRRTLTIQRGTRVERTLVRDGLLARFRDGRTTEEPVPPERLRTVVRELFGITLPETRLLFETYT
jgi:N-hydroxyarylamine O-acetyltransferase